jgi:hypothetical protein
MKDNWDVNPQVSLVHNETNRDPHYELIDVDENDNDNDDDDSSMKKHSTSPSTLIDPKILFGKPQKLPSM